MPDDEKGDTQKDLKTFNWLKVVGCRLSSMKIEG